MTELMFNVRIIGALLLGSCAAFYGYFGTYRLIGRLLGPSLGLGLISAPISLIIAIYLASKTSGLFWRACDSLERRFKSSHKKQDS